MVDLKENLDAIQVSDGNSSVTPIKNKKVFIVFQKTQTYKNEKLKGMIKVAIFDKSGKRHYYWDNIEHVEASDIIFHMSNKQIKAISIAKGIAQPIDSNHKEVKCEYHELNNAIDLDNFKNEIINACKGIKNTPFNIKGKGNQGYLYDLPQVLTKLFIDEAKKLNSDMDFTFLNGISSGNKTQNNGGINMKKLEQKLTLNMILYGPPGTGKTYNTRKYAVAICDKQDVNDKDYVSEIIPRYNQLVNDGRIKFVTFHQSYGYEEFIEGIKPESKNGVIEYPIKSGCFKTFCENAVKDENKNNNYVFIIDEINRGNISKIFGELITLIEPSKRGGEKEEMSAILPYSGTLFSVSKNVYILGTMNTADRSISLMDTALRRRFDFIEMMPDSSIVANIIVDGVDIKNMLDAINKRITVLYDREHTIGHAFFTSLNNNSKIEDLASIFKNKVIPLLQEYFYEDYSKIRLVLGDNGKDEKYQFVKEIDNSKDRTLFKGNYDPDIVENYNYEINDDALTEPESYKQIY